MREDLEVFGKVSQNATQNRRDDRVTAVVEGLQLYVYEGATGKNGEGKTRDLSQLQRE